MDLYRPLLAKALFPAFEAARGRPTVPLLALPAADRAVVARRAARSAGGPAAPPRPPRVPPHGVLPRGVRRARPARPRTSTRSPTWRSCRCSIATPLRATLEDAHRDGAAVAWRSRRRRAAATGQPVVVRYNAESRHWRDATAGAATAGAATRSGCARSTTGASAGQRTTLVEAPQDRARSRAQARPLRRLHAARRRGAARRGRRRSARFKPHVIVAYASGAGGARAVRQRARAARRGTTIPVLDRRRAAAGRTIARRSSRRSARRSRPTAAAR